MSHTDTTVGFLSSNDKKLNSIKQRSLKQKILTVVNNFDTLKKQTRVPNKFKNKVRKSKNTTFIYPNKNSFRVISRNSFHMNFINKFNYIYSTSANLSSQTFDEDFAVENSDVIVYTKDKFTEGKSSEILKISRNKIVKVR